MGGSEGYVQRLPVGNHVRVAITDFELAKRENYFGITVLSTRALGNFGLSEGWFCTFAPVAFNVSAASSFTEVAAAAQSGYANAKILSAVPIQTVLQALLASGVAGSEVAASPNMLSYIDFRWFPGAGTSADKNAIQFTGEGETANASMWFNRDADHLYLGAQTPRTPLAQKQIALYHAHLRNVIATVAREGDYAIRAPRTPELAFARHDD